MRKPISGITDMTGPDGKKDTNDTKGAPRTSDIADESALLAHELLQPLTAIAANAEAARRCLQSRHDDVAAIRQIVDDMYLEARRALGIVEWIRGELRGDMPMPDLVDLEQAIAEVLAIFRTDAMDKGIQLAARIDAHPMHVRGSHVQIQQVLINLVRNAVQATRSAPAGNRHVSLHASRDGPWVRIAVRDTGAGTPEDSLERIFQPHVTGRPDGLGLGLSISRQIARRQGGELLARNNSSCGMTFYLTLPWAEDAVAAGTSARVQAETERSGPYG